jgi:ribosome-associated heat shock protein Hsp15
MSTVRIDKWLWAARFFKTRALAARACELGRIQFGIPPGSQLGQSGSELSARPGFRANVQAICKPAREVRVGDMLRITNEGGEFEVEVLGVSDVRGPASLAQSLYRETDASRQLRMKVAAERKALREWEQLPATRPNKRDRRRIIQFRSGRAPE